MRSLPAVLAFAAGLAAASGFKDLGAAPETSAVRELPADGVAVARVASLHVARVAPTATRLRDGRILVAGGFDEAQLGRPEAEIYDPRTGEWTETGSMRQGRYRHIAALLPDGRVLVAGGRASARGDSLDSAEIYDPATGAWSDAAPMPDAVDSGSAASFRDGRVLVTGGYRASGGVGEHRDGTFRFDPRTGRWTSLQPLPAGRSYLAAVRLTDGRVAVIGGAGQQTPFADVLAYGPRGARWTALQPLPAFNEDPQSVVLEDGRVLAAGGYALGKTIPGASLSDPSIVSWTPAGRLLEPRFGHVLAAWGRRALVAGGVNQARASVATTEIFDEDRRQWTRGPAMTTPRDGAAVAALDADRFLVIGGKDGMAALATSEIVDLRDPPGPAAASPAAPIARRAPPKAPSPAPVAPPPAFSRKAPERPNDYALVVGIGRYKTLPQAEFADGDAREMAAAFAALGVPEENVVTLTGERASLADVTKYVEEWLPRRVEPDSRVFFYFSGHGSPDVKDGTVYLMPWDADASFVRSTGFPLKRLYDALGALPAKQVVAVLDACFSGAGGRSVVAAGTRPLVTVRLPATTPPKVSVLAAAEKDEIAGAFPERGHGLFSYYVLRGLDGEADPGKTGHVTLEQLHAYVRKHVVIDARKQDREQTPTLTGPDKSLRLY